MYMKKTLSFMRSLCMGQIEEDIIIPFPKLEASEQSAVKDMINSIENWLKTKKDDFRKWDRKGEMPLEFIKEMKDYGLFSLIIPEQYGGLGLKSKAYSRIMQEISKYDGSVALTAGAHSSIGMRGLLLFGTEEQKKKYLPKLATGEMIAAFGLTEAGAGSDAASIKTKATRDGKNWILDGEKIWITNGGLANFFTVFARTDGPEGQMTAFIVTRDMHGVSSGPHEDKMGLRASSTTTIHFDKVHIPSENVLGEVGKGFKVAMTILNNGRIGLGGGCVGAMKHCIELATQQAKNRTQFGRPIFEFGLVKQKLGHMVVECYASESAVTMVSGLIDHGYSDFAVEAAISKVFASECLWRTVDESLQIAAGNGYMCEFPYERILRDCRVNRIFEGTNDILRLFIALTAINDVGKQLKELSSSLEGIFNDPIKGFGVLSEYTLKRVSHVTGIGGTKSAFTKLHTSLKDKAEIFEDSTRDLAQAADRIIRKHGKNIIGKQFATRRLADIMIDLFVLGSVLSRVNSAIEEHGLTKSTKELEILEVFAGQVYRRVKSNFGKIDNNDDELIKSLADHAVENERYIWDTV
ncbi:acyl-CoA dehydrogenase family protein [Candidatus Nomurabacteria bacterium]|nr:acyl-CoA dehydrogenase family protein [Candidatus Nomurabacteria bacterium]